MRSKLFVPATRPDVFAKALAGAAEALSFDLEDAVPPAAKAAARAELVAFLGSDRARNSAKTLIVRVNGPDTPHFADDIAAMATGRVDLINVPKCDDAATVSHVHDAIVGVSTARLLITIETPSALARAAAIASHPNVAGLQVGLNDLFAPLGIDRKRAENVHAALWAIRMAAAQAGCFAYDGAWPDISDESGLRAEAELAHSLGYIGKSCIHPSQVVVVNATFEAGAGDIERAQRIVAGAQAAAAAGRGAFTLDGEMIDRPAIDRAQALLAQNGAGQRAS